MSAASNSGEREANSRRGSIQALAAAFIIGGPVKSIPALIAVAFLLSSMPVLACGTHAPAKQASIDAAELASLRALASAAARDADQVFIGTVTSLTRPSVQSGEFGSVTFRVAESLKGRSPSRLAVRWKDTFTYSCRPSETFYNVGFRQGGAFIVYVRDGQAFRSAAADHLRSGLLSLDEERAATASVGGSQQFIQPDADSRRGFTRF